MEVCILTENTKSNAANVILILSVQCSLLVETATHESQTELYHCSQKPLFVQQIDMQWITLRSTSFVLNMFR